ncbi:MAG: hypothetical protein K9J16_00970 [Melioribacteraceae bacterium]|nr:hypothetical protein [Melioribacteraceae bacterium]MCF8354021.1 hypothetical protein [Melioribacteraceae bacterium]MCF8392298.1 hypothetical protein [Melioribacteraceae bacterium]MCF8417630.1 hypothetical protein [Melioribacteraceae bacterium]
MRENSNSEIKIPAQYENLSLFFLALHLFLGISAQFVSSNNYLNFKNIDEQNIRVITIILNTLVILVFNIIRNRIRTNQFEAKNNIFIYCRFSLAKVIVLLFVNTWNAYSLLATNDYIYLGIFAVITVMAFIYRPTQKGFEKEFQK